MKPKKSWAGNILVPLMVAGLNAAVILFPRESLEAAKGGLTLWLNNVLPSLLPFAAGVNILTGLGVVRFIGALLEPVTRSVFRVPGSGGVAVAAGFMSGYPMGAKITAELRADGSLTAAQAQRLISFSNTSGPLFIIGAVGAGMFGDPLAGYLLYTAHILGALTVGLCFRFYKSKEEPPRDTRKKKLLTHAFDEMSRARGVKGFGEVLGSGVMKAMETMLLVGGFIILFSVVTRILGELRVFSLAGSELGKALAAGFIEVTNGVSLLSETAPVKLALISAAGAVSWGGLSIHAQSVSLFAHTDIKAAPYFFAKALHAVLGTAWAAVLYPLYEWLKSKDAAPVFSTFADAVFPVQQLQYSSKIFFQSLLILFSASLLIIFIRKLSRR